MEYTKGFEDYFDIFRGMPNIPPKQPQTKEEIRANALLKTFAKLDKDDKVYIKEIVIRYSEEVHSSGRADLIKAHAKAALFVGEIASALQSYSKLTVDLTDEESAVKGLIEFQQGNYSKAEQYLKLVKDIPNAILALSEIDIKNGHKHPAVHKERLEKLLPHSYKANVFMGVANFNTQRYREAEGNFQKALHLNLKPSIEDKLNLLRAKLAQGKSDEVMSVMGRFYHDTNCSLSPDQMQKELDKRNLEFPEFKVDAKTLYEVVLEKDC